MSRLSALLLPDYREEGWASMDLTAEMTLDGLTRRHSSEVDARLASPPYRQLATRVPAIGRKGAARNVDRLLNRMRVYPGWLRREIARRPADIYHLMDHSYSQLIHELPAGRTVVTCHDLDTFRCLLHPDLEPRPRWFRSMMQRILRGFRSAGHVVCNSQTTLDAIIEHKLLPASRLSVAYMGISPEFSAAPNPEADAEATRLLGLRAPDQFEILHVGTTIPRKRIDVLLRVVASLKLQAPNLRLVKVGHDLTPPQRELAAELGLLDTIVKMPRLERTTLAAIYRRASVVLVTSDAEGFGLPVAEALACGAPILASDIPALREVGGQAANYAPVADLDAWVSATRSILDRGNPQSDLRKAEGVEWARRYSWNTHADHVAEVYKQLIEASRAPKA